MFDNVTKRHLNFRKLHMQHEAREKLYKFVSMCLIYAAIALTIIGLVVTHG